MPTHFSLDIETLDTATTAVVLSIGICRFDEIKTGPFLHVGLEIEEQLIAGRTISDNTYHWWVEQLIGMSESPFPKERSSIRSALGDLNGFIYANTEGNPLSNAYLWVRGPHFDWSILQSLAAPNTIAKTYNIPIEYSHVRDQRTYCAGEEFTGVVECVTAHNALNDALNQAHFIQQVAKKYKRPLC